MEVDDLKSSLEKEETQGHTTLISRVAENSSSWFGMKEKLKITQKDQRI